MRKVLFFQSAISAQTRSVKFVFGELLQVYRLASQNDSLHWINVLSILLVYNLCVVNMVVGVCVCVCVRVCVRLQGVETSNVRFSCKL